MSWGGGQGCTQMSVHRLQLFAPHKHHPSLVLLLLLLLPCCCCCSLAGGVSFLGGLALWLSSLEVARRSNYEVFYKLHHIGEFFGGGEGGQGGVVTSLCQ